MILAKHGAWNTIISMYCCTATMYSNYPSKIYSKRDLILQAEYLSINQKSFNLTLISIPFWISVVVQRFISSEDVCWNIWNVKLSLFSSQKCIIYYISLCLSPHVCFFFLPLQIPHICLSSNPPPPQPLLPNTTAQAQTHFRHFWSCGCITCKGLEGLCYDVAG